MLRTASLRSIPPSHLADWDMLTVEANGPPDAHLSR